MNPGWFNTAHPFVGRLSQAPKLTGLFYRILVIDPYPVFYKVKGQTVLVHGILHGARNFLSSLFE